MKVPIGVTHLRMFTFPLSAECDSAWFYAWVTRTFGGIPKAGRTIFLFLIIFLIEASAIGNHTFRQCVERNSSRHLKYLKTPLKFRESMYISNPRCKKKDVMYIIRLTSASLLSNQWNNCYAVFFCLKSDLIEMLVGYYEVVMIISSFRVNFIIAFVIDQF